MEVLHVLGSIMARVKLIRIGGLRRVYDYDIGAPISTPYMIFVSIHFKIMIVSSDRTI